MLTVHTEGKASVEVPQQIEAEGGTAIDAYVAAIRAGETPEDAAIAAGVDLSPAAPNATEEPAK